MDSLTVDWAAGRRLDILVLGPMGEKGADPSTVLIRDAIEELLEQQVAKDLLASRNIREVAVHVPEGQNEPDIIENILGLLDTADLVVFDISPKKSNPDRANVFYELGLVHSLGIPVMLLIRKGQKVPFYVHNTAHYRVAKFSVPALVKVLKSPLHEFLDWEHRRTSFTNNPISKFYGLPVVDISAAVGLATGYYYNFISRLITEGGFLSHYPGVIKQVVYVRPSSVNSTYEADAGRLKAALLKEGYELEKKELQAISSDDKGPIWFDHVNGIVLDIPRTIYPLRRSPRLLSLHGRHATFSSTGAEKVFYQRRSQIEANLLDRVKAAIDFQVRHDGPRVRAEILHFTTIEEAPAVVRARLS